MELNVLVSSSVEDPLLMGEIVREDGWLRENNIVITHPGHHHLQPSLYVSDSSEDDVSTFLSHLTP